MNLDTGMMVSYDEMVKEITDAVSKGEKPAEYRITESRQARRARERAEYKATLKQKKRSEYVS